MIINPAGILKCNVGGGTVAPPPYLPLSLPHCEEYYDSRLLTGAHGSSVNPWPDLSGHTPIRDMGLQAPQAVPTLNVSSGLSPKGKQLVAWNGIGGLVTGQMLGTGVINPFPPATRGHSFYCYADWRLVTSPPAPFAGAVLWDTSLFNSCPKELIPQTTGGLVQWRDTGFHGATAANTGVHQYAWTFDTLGVGRIYLDGVLLFSAGYTFAGSAADGTVLSDVNVPLNCNMGHFVWYSEYHAQATVSLHKIWASVYMGF